MKNLLKINLPKSLYWCLVDANHHMGDLVWVSVVAPLGRSDHSSLSIAISMAQAILTCVLAGGCF